MDILVKDTRGIYRHEITQELGEDCTGKDVLDYIFGTYETDYRGNSDIVLRKWVVCNKTMNQRLNMFWAVPLTFLLSPFMYIKSGNVGWDDNTRLGKFILKVTGHLKEE